MDNEFVVGKEVRFIFVHIGIVTILHGIAIAFRPINEVFVHRIQTDGIDKFRQFIKSQPLNG